MAKCPNCGTNISLRFSNDAVCPKCNRRLVGTITPISKLLLIFLLLIECIISIVVAVIAGSTNYPFVPKWLVAAVLLFAIIIITLVLMLYLLQKMISYRQV